MTDDLYSQIKDELRGRTDYETKQATWYNMRFTGLGRPKTPYPGAPDVHYALCDAMIDKLSPFYIGQIYGQDRLATFTSNKPQSEDDTSAAEMYFDYVLKQQTNFERSLFTAIDHMLMYGRGPVKIFWNPREKKIEFSAIRPIYIIVPSWTEELGTADWLVHVMHMSVAQYRQNKLFNQDDDFIASITGKGSGEQSQQQEQDKLRRQGITYGQSENQIVLWEVYRRDGDDIMVDTISPILGPPEDDDPEVRPAFGMPYPHGCFPFADLRYEITDPDYYSPRGVPEILAEDELYLCKLRNQKLQWMDFMSQPMFENDGTLPNLGNLTMRPGKLLPSGVRPIPASPAPPDFMEEMQLSRALAESRIQVPDLNASEHLAGDMGAKGQVTATQINAVVSQSATGNDKRVRIYRLQLSEIYRQAWAVQTWANPSGPWQLGDLSEVPKTAIHSDYRISPSGSADGYSKEKRIQRAMGYYQLFAQTFPINQSPDMTELGRWILEQDDPDLADRFIKEPQGAQNDQLQKQAQENLLMQDNFTPQVHPSDDPKSHLTGMAQWVQDKMKNGVPISPPMAQKLLVHGQQHVAQIKHHRDAQGMALVQQLQPVVMLLRSIIAQAQQAPMPGAQPPMPMQPHPALA